MTAERAYEAAVGCVDTIVNVGHAVAHFGFQEENVEPRNDQGRNRAN